MKLILRYMKQVKWRILFGMFIKFLGTMTELMVPYVMEHLIDNVAPNKEMGAILLWGAIMLLLVFVTRLLNVTANRRAVRTAQHCTYDLRQELFFRTLCLSGNQVDQIGLPSLISRMTSDSYNVQNFIRMFQTMGIRGPIILLGGICVTLTMDVGLASILCILAPIMIVLVSWISMKGVPLYNKVQQRMDEIVRVMREGITGIRVVKALSKEQHEKDRFAAANDEMTRQDRRAGIVMALPGPLLTMALNIGLVIVVVVGANRVNAGLTKPGVILAFLTYFNMILNGVMGVTRIFLQMSKANASANRIDEVLQCGEDLPVLPEAEGEKSAREGMIVFDHVSFAYGAAEQPVNEERRMAVRDITLSVQKGGSLGIIGATGSGKTTLINLLMRFYDVTSGHIYVNGKDIRTYDRNELRRMFGVVFQNDMIFADTLEENIAFGRTADPEEMRRALRDAQAAFVDEYEDGLQHEAAIRGSNFSGGQRQRLLISRALAKKP